MALDLGARGYDAAPVDRIRHLETLTLDSQRLGEAAARDMAAAVPYCPGWTVRDVVTHVAEVYEHKIAAIQGRGERPDPWPPAWPEDRDPLHWFDDVRERLLDTLANTDSTAPSWTWSPQNQTAGFWIRRMAQETAVHRVDVEAATGAVGPVDPELALDGIDEALLVMLAGDWSDLPQVELTGTVSVATDQRVWQVAMTFDEVTVIDGVGSAAANPAAEPAPLLLWVWGRAPDSTVKITGDRGAANRLRMRLALAQ